MWMLKLAAVATIASARITPVDETDQALDRFGADDDTKELLQGYSIPEADNEQDQNELKCSACHTTLHAVLDVFSKMRKKARKNDDMSWIKEFHLSEKMEGICEDMSQNIGLLGRKEDKEITARFTSKIERELAQDEFKITPAWVAKFWKLYCPRYADRFELVSLSLFRRDSDVRVCPECKEAKMPGFGAVLKKKKQKRTSDEL